MTEIILNTTVHQPSMTADETEMLLFALERARAQFAWKCGGLDRAALSKALPPSTMTLGGLLKHLALVEDTHFTGQPLGGPWVKEDFDADPDWEWHSAAGDSPEELYELWQGAVQRSQALLAALLADGGLDQRSARDWNGQSPNLRRMVIDLSDEYCRHLGHADLLREAIDGLTGEDPPQS